MSNVEFEQTLRRAKVVPVLTIAEVEGAVALARALLAGGLPVLEVTLRTPAALTAIERIAAEVPGVIVGAGTILGRDDATRAARAGARFLVSPGATDNVLAAMADTGLPALPGCATATEAMRLAERGVGIAKFFPAEQAGGVRYLNALGAPLPGFRFCPTGGISASNAARYLACPNVVCVGGSWVAPVNDVAVGNWARITGLSAAAARL
jgi:2-dehydro-3-deoxyphosphogluconate aldolase/(4S)-4-hydroxy-2-oxoglutarate aldolase